MLRLELLEVLTSRYLMETECYVDKRTAYMTGTKNETRYYWSATSLLPSLQNYGIEILTTPTGVALPASDGAAGERWSLVKLPHESRLHLPVLLRCPEHVVKLARS